MLYSVKILFAMCVQCGQSFNIPFDWVVEMYASRAGLGAVIMTWLRPKWSSILVMQSFDVRPIIWFVPTVYSRCVFTKHEGENARRIYCETFADRAHEALAYEALAHAPALGACVDLKGLGLGLEWSSGFGFMLNISHGHWIGQRHAGIEIKDVLETIKLVSGSNFEMVPWW